MRFAPIASGSSGNCIYVGSNNTHLLVDVGISGKRVDEGLRNLDLCGQDLDHCKFLNAAGGVNLIMALKQKLKMNMKDHIMTSMV